MKNIFKSTWFAVATLLISMCCSSTLQAQLPQDVRDVFEGMLESLDDDLKAKFQKAIDDDTSKVEFTAEEFMRFRNDPANPFEGLHRIKVKKGGSNIALKFELPSMRNRKLSELERQHPRVLARLKSPARSSAASIVKVFSKQRHIAMGAIVSSSGYFVTKASEVQNRVEISAQLASGQKFPARMIRFDKANDMAVMRIDVSGLNPIRWSEAQPKLGSFVLTPNQDGSLIAMGSYSVRPRSTIGGEQAFLGVQPQTTTGGVRIHDVNPGSASYLAGLRDGDIIYSLDKKSITDVAGLVKTIRDHRPGDTVKIDYRREGVAGVATATLRGRNVSGERAARFKMMNRLGAVPSRRDTDFPVVFQHDTPLFPEHCGGPILDLDGNVLGLNIARHGRAATYAIPASHAKNIVESLLRENVASAGK